jgi:LuxR family maltose regulon positive regulatory protein
MIRPRLKDRVLRAARGPLTSLTAPAGYGKTVLIDQWAAAHRGRPVVRLDLSPHVAGDERRATHLLEQMQQVGDTILVVDGLDTPRQPQFAADLDRAIADAPPELHFLIARRSHGPASLDSGLARGIGTDIDAAELAFTPDEAAGLVRDVAGIDLSDVQLGEVLERTEGWAAGIVLLARLLEGVDDRDPVISGFTGEDRHVAAFLTDRALTGLPERQRDFLLRTSVLERLDGPSCEALTGDPASGAMLDLLEHHGLFVRPADGRVATFTYHPLFRDLLRRELRLSAPGAEATTLLAAAQWHISNDEPGPAARCLIDADRSDLLVDLGDRFGRAMFESGKPRDVLQWLTTVADESGRSHTLALRRAYLHTMLGETSQAGQILHDLPQRDLTPGETLAADALRATWVFFDGRAEAVITAADAVLQVLDEIDPADVPDIFQLTSRSSLWTIATGSRARAQWALGDIDAARAGFASVLEHDDVYPPWLVHTLSAAAMLEAWVGNLRAATDLAHRALRTAARADLSAHPSTLDARVALACVHREEGQLRKARYDLEGAAAIAARTRRPVTTAILAVEEARWQLASGVVDQAMIVLEKHRADGLPLPAQIDHHLAATEVRLLVELGELDRARSVLDRVGEPLPDVLVTAAVHIAVADGDLARAQTLLDGWELDRAQGGARLDHELWSAIVEMEGGDRRSAVRRGSPVAARATVEGRVRLFLDAGPAGERLLRALARDPDTQVAGSLLQAAPAGEDAATATLSDREREVVRYLPTALSSAEIAAQLYISLNTLKTHLHSIYRKLEVHGRSEAIERAKELGLA